MNSYPFSVLFGPGYIGLVVTAAMFGIEICQIIFYLRAFRNDKVTVKLQVFVVVILDTLHFFVVVSNLYEVLIGCRRNTSPRCTHYVSWTIISGIAIGYCIAFLVQIFYAQRVWIISGQSRAITCSVVAATTLQLAFGLMFVAELTRTPTLAVLDSTMYSALAAVASAICDAIITISVMYYLRPTVIRRGDYIKRLVVVFVQMGLFTFCNVLAMVILYFLQNHTLGQLLNAAPGIILSTSYVNSMLAVLNARKSLRDQQLHPPAIELPTLPVPITQPQSESVPSA